MSGAVINRLAAALRARVDAQRRAEERLASFAFTERPSPVPEATDGRDADVPISDWRYFVGRTLRAAGDPEALRLLVALGAGPVTTDRLADVLGHAASDHLAIVDRVGGLAASGLVTRELARDEVSLTPLGEAVLELVAALEARAAADAS